MVYLYEKDDTIYTKCANCGMILKFKKFQLGELKTGVECFCGNISNTIDGMPEKSKVESKKCEKSIDAPKPASSYQPTHTYATPTRKGPVCPTCGSKNISKISLTSKAVGGVMFGVLSSNIRNTFKCNDCGYKW